MAWNCIPAYNAGALLGANRDELMERSRLCGTPGYPWDYGTKQITLAEQYAAGQVSGCNFAQIAKTEVGKYSPERGCYKECKPGYHANPYAYAAQQAGNYTPCVADFVDEFEAGSFFKEVGLAAAYTAAYVYSAGTASPWIAAAQYATQTYQTLEKAGVVDMGIDLGGIFGGVSSILGGFESGNYLGALQGAAQIGSAFAQQSNPAVYSQMFPAYQPTAVATVAPMAATPVMSAAPAFAAAAGAVARVTAPILNKIAVKLGLRARPSLTRAMDMIRKAAKLLTSPEATAAALGVTVAELATLITASSARKRRRMNPANSKALRRAARRIKSFHRLCTHTDVLRSRSRRSTGLRCGSCKKSPCRC